MNFLTNCLIGIGIGAGAILPGISSGVFCVIFGIYEKLLNSILNFFSDIKHNFKFLFPIIVGTFLGVILFSKVLNYCLFTFPIQTNSIFIGLILGSMPSLIKQINKNSSNSKKNYILFFLLSFFVGIGCTILEHSLSISTTSDAVTFPYLVLCGFLMSIGVVIPGVSSTIILMLLGVYQIYLSSVSSLYFPILVPMGIGLVLGGLFFMKLTKFFLDSFYAPTFYCILGFSVGSISVLLPNISSPMELAIAIFSCILGFLIASSLEKK